MAEETEPVRDLVMALSSALDAFEREPEFMRGFTNPRYVQLLEQSEQLTQAFRAAAARKKSDCSPK